MKDLPSAKCCRAAYNIGTSVLLKQLISSPIKNNIS